MSSSTSMENPFKDWHPIQGQAIGRKFSNCESESEPLTSHEHDLSIRYPFLIPCSYFVFYYKTRLMITQFLYYNSFLSIPILRACSAHSINCKPIFDPWWRKSKWKRLYWNIVRLLLELLIVFNIVFLYFILHRHSHVCALCFSIYVYICIYTYAYTYAYIYKQN